MPTPESLPPSPDEKNDAVPAASDEVELDELVTEFVKRERVSGDSALRAASDSAIRAAATGGRVTDIVKNAEQAERVRSLDFAELRIDPDRPEESPDLLQHEALYNELLLSDEAIQRLLLGDESLYEEEMAAGRMMNRFHPTERELEKYRELYALATDQAGIPYAYESVRQQHVADMLGLPGRAGRYRIFGLRDPARPDRLVASLSLRQPPKSVPEREAYILAMAASLERVQFSQGWKDHETMARIPDTAEIDTIITHPGYRGAGFRILHDALAALQAEGGMPGHFIYYRSNGIAIDGVEGQEHPPGVNSSSYKFFVHKLGFADMGDRSDDRDVLVREVVPGGELFVAKTRWTFGHRHAAKLLKRVAAAVDARGLVQGGSRLILPS